MTQNSLPCKQALDLVGLRRVDWADVEMQPILDVFWIVGLQEHDRRSSRISGDREPSLVVVGDPIAQRCTPELRRSFGIMAIDHKLTDPRCHAVIRIRKRHSAG